MEFKFLQMVIGNLPPLGEILAARRAYFVFIRCKLCKGSVKNHPHRARSVLPATFDHLAVQFRKMVSLGVVRPVVSTCY